MTSAFDNGESLAFQLNYSQSAAAISDTIASQDPLSMKISMTILYTVILVTGVFGNICTCIVIARNRYMRTATNYYLFSLSVSDLLLLLLGLPQDAFALWRKRPYLFGETFCIIRGLTSETSTNASVLTITAFTIERYLAICHPLRAHTMSKLSRVIRLIVVIWFCALVCALPVASQFGIVYEKNKNGDYDKNTAECSMVAPIKYSFEISFMVFFVFPAILLSVLYMFIGIHLRHSDAMKCSNEQFDSSHHHHHHPPPPPPQHPLNNQPVDTLQAYDNSPESGDLITKYRISLVKDNNCCYSKIKANFSSENNNHHTNRSSLRGFNSAASSSTASRQAVIRMLGK